MYEIVNGSPGECLSDRDGNCSGEIGLHESSTGASASFRCAFHQAEQVERMRPLIERVRKDYPGFDVPGSLPPPWFDPAYAGESWDEPE